MLEEILKSMIGHAIVASGRAIKIANLKMFAENNLKITPEQYIVLSIINNEAISYPNKLCKELYKDKSNMARLLSILEKEGCIKKIQTTENKKLVNQIQITQKGKDIKNEIAPYMEKSRASYLKDISADEMYTCIKVLTKIHENLEQKE